MHLSARSFQRRHLGRRLVLVAQAACDLRDLDTAIQLLLVAELLLRTGAMTARDRLRFIDLIVGAHVRVWELRHDGRKAPASAHKAQCAPGAAAR